MKAKDLIKILEKSPEAEVLIIAGDGKRTYVADSAESMAHTVFIVAPQTPYEYDMDNIPTQEHTA